LEIFYAFVTCAVGIWLIGSAAGGYMAGVGKLVGVWSKLAIFVSGFLIAMPEWQSDLVGLILGLIVAVIVLLKKRGSISQDVDSTPWKMKG